MTDEKNEMRPAPFSQIMFAAHLAEADFGEAVYDLSADSGFDFTRIDGDHYDNSIEFYGVPPDARMNEGIQRLIFDAGFSIAYVNHTDGWETHYGFRDKEFKVSDGSRIKYGNKQSKKENVVYVENFPVGWPKDWLKSGYVKVVEITRKIG